MNITWNDLQPIIEVCVPILTGVGFFYFRLSSRIEKTDQKVELFRQEMREDRKAIDQKFDQLDQKFEAKFDRIDQKLDRITELFVIKNIHPSRHTGKNHKGKTA